VQSSHTLLWQRPDRRPGADNWWSITGTFSVADPNQGFRQAVNGSSTWQSGYLYVNFNF
jgi:hypothetical protein